jgi:hypothetical protein
MATIKITNLYSTGSELFQDSESYLNEVTDEEMTLGGGFGFTIAVSFPHLSFRPTIIISFPFPTRPR